MKPWIPHTIIQYGKLLHIKHRLNLTDCVLPRRRLSLTSYTLSKAYSLLTYYLRGEEAWQPNWDTAGYRPQHPETTGKFENTLLALICMLNPDAKTAIELICRINDRGNQELTDPNSTVKPIAVTYIPKGITNFIPYPENKTLNAELSAKLQRQIIKENNTDPTLTSDTDKTITIKVYTNLFNIDSDDSYFHVYFNKRSCQTVRRVLYKTFVEYYRAADLNDAISDDTVKEICTTIINAFDNPENVDIDDLLAKCTAYTDNLILKANENLIKDFATTKQKSMNATRLNILKDNAKNAKMRLDRNIADFMQYSKECRLAEKALSDYNEVEFTAIEVFLNNIKNAKSTVFLNKRDAQYIQFCIEEPIIHTENEVWARYLDNTASDVNRDILNFANHAYTTYGTTTDILRFATQRFIKELFVDQKIKLYTAAMLGINSTSSHFEIEKFLLNNDQNLFPHPHIGGNGLTCWSEASRAVTAAIMQDDGETAYLQLSYALQQMTATDQVVTRRLIQDILHTNNSDKPVYLRKGNTERESFNTILKEFIKNETDKINRLNTSDC